MKTLVVFYSRDGTTKEIAKTISKVMNADIEEVIDLKNRRGFFAYFTAGYEAGNRKLAAIKKTKKDPNRYDLIVIGTPIWSWKMTPAVRTYIENNKSNFKKVAFFCVMGGSGDKDTFLDMATISKKKPVATVSFRTFEVKQKNYQEKVKEFAKKIKK